MSARAFVAAWAEATADARAQLDALDAVAGDGDHGTTVARGAAAASADLDHDDATADDDGGAVVVRAARAFTDAAGGASGPLIGVVLREIGRAWGDAPLDDDALATGLRQAADAVARLGGAEPGDATLLDALLAAAHSPAEAAAGAGVAALATADLPKRKGRAALVAGAGVGHEDPGARSVAILLATLERTTAGERA